MKIGKFNWKLIKGQVYWWFFVWAKNFKELREILDENGAAGYAIEFFDDGPFDVKECYRFFDTAINHRWEKLGTITPKGGKKYVIFIPSYKE